MRFYEIELLSAPRFDFACSVEYDKYQNRFDHRTDLLEIAVCEAGRVLYEHADGTRELVTPGMLVCIASDLCCDAWAYEGEKQRHSTVGVSMQYRAVRYSSASECDLGALRARLHEGRTILIPYQVELGAELEEILYLIREIAACRFSETPSGNARAMARWYELCARLTDFVYERLKEDKKIFSPSEEIYAARAERYIADRYATRLSVREIAAHLGISEGHLHRIFKSVKGVSILEFINRRRISIALELIRAKRLTLAEAAYNVGIEDPAYMSRLFKRVTGMSYREYVRTNP